MSMFLGKDATYKLTLEGIHLTLLSQGNQGTKRKSHNCLENLVQRGWHQTTEAHSIRHLPALFSQTDTQPVWLPMAGGVTEGGWVSAPSSLPISPLFLPAQIHCHSAYGWQDSNGQQSILDGSNFIASVPPGPRIKHSLYPSVMAECWKIRLFALRGPWIGDGQSSCFNGLTTF